ncbi:uncharacterized protein LOC122502850 [Leptopilina heterotoma]|uniref:uncharacterized protein LOC122502850 n=1 Tax=Leptopilina heterotoma TaxID=63436 RepID=UPI001CA9F937|nr:uncharacterized protein LOC122502850 [Leptopilina heterotoma]
MKNLGIFLIFAVLFVSVKSVPWNQWSWNNDFSRDFNKSMEMEGFDSQMEQMDKMAKEMTEQAKLQIEEATIEVEKAKVQVEKTKKLTHELKNVILEKGKILEIAEQIENGNPPADVDSKTTFLTTNVKGEPRTNKITIFSFGNSAEGSVNTVQTTYEGSKKVHSSVTIYAWNANGSITTTFY